MSVLAIRDYTDADRSYVISSWLHNYWPHARPTLPPNVSRGEFDANLDAQIKHGLANGMRVVIAYDTEHPLVIVGWLAFGPGPTLHYVYVGRVFRHAGVCRELCSAAYVRLDKAVIDDAERARLMALPPWQGSIIPHTGTGEVQATVKHSTAWGYAQPWMKEKP